MALGPLVMESMDIAPADGVGVAGLDGFTGTFGGMSAILPVLIR